MSANNPLGIKLKQRFDQVKSSRSTWDSNYEDLRRLVRPDGQSFNSTTTPGGRRYDDIYDGTAVDACEEFASGLHAYLSSPTERWFELTIPSIRNLQDHVDVMTWLDAVATIIYAVFCDPRTNFNTSMSECYLDIGAFGTGVVNTEWNIDDQHIVFRNDALSQFYFEEDAKGKITRVWQYFEMTGQNILDDYLKDGLLEGTDLWKKVVLPANASKKFKLIRHVCPRTDRVYGKMDAKNKSIASWTLSEETMDVIRDSGYDSFPYAVTRWVKIGGEIYGRGPAMKCMPDIQGLQTMERTMLKAGQKAVDPPLVVPNDGFMEPISTAPGSKIFKEPGTEKIEALDFKGNVQFGLEQCEQKRSYIRKCFHEDWFKRFRKNREQSATEVNDDRDEMLRFLAPMLGRQQNELLGPLIYRTFSVLLDQGWFPPAPPMLAGKRMMVSYTSPAARAQQSVVADRVARFLADVTPLAQADPSVMDGIIPDKVVQVFATARGVPREVLRTFEEVQALREQRQQAQQAQQAAAVAEPASKALLNIANANKAGGGGLPGGAQL